MNAAAQSYLLKLLQLYSIALPNYLLAVSLLPIIFLKNSFSVRQVTTTNQCKITILKSTELKQQADILKN